MKVKGFTLVELLAVIVILALLALLTSTAIANLLDNAKNDLSSIQINLIESAAKSWGAANISKLPTDGECKYLTLKDLKDAGLLDQDVTDPKTNKNIKDDLKVKITAKRGKQGNLITEYEVNPDSINGCTNAKLYTDASGANIPDLLDGALTPVIYKEDHWEVADTNEEWYDYGTKEWANAVILKENINKKVGDTLKLPVSPEDADNSDVLAMFVWIPRYSYTISSTAKGENTGTDTYAKYLNPGLIDIRFVSKSTSESGKATYTGDSPNEWYTHPAFTFGSVELSGIWVGKFETTGNGDVPTILPNQQSLRDQNISTQFSTAQKFNDKITGDSHMMKNSEWGAVAYLSHSKYGKDGEVYINNCSEYITGIGADSASASSSKDTCITDKNKYNGTSGVKASTTGNVYGVYDMSGGASDYVMGYLTTAYTTTWGAYMGKFMDKLTEIDSAKFTQVPDSKYFDAYTVENSNNETYKGHALGETGGWYGDSTEFVSTEYPWFRRGGSCFSESSAGVFHFSHYYGINTTVQSFRVVFAPTM